MTLACSTGGDSLAQRLVGPVGDREKKGKRLDDERMMLYLSSPQRLSCGGPRHRWGD